MRGRNGDHLDARSPGCHIDKDMASRVLSDAILPGIGPVSWVVSSVSLRSVCAERRWRLHCLYVGIFCYIKVLRLSGPTADWLDPERMTSPAPEAVRPALECVRLVPFAEWLASTWRQIVGKAVYILHVSYSHSISKKLKPLFFSTPMQ